MVWAEACIRDNRNAYKILVGAPKKERPLAGLGRRRDYGINFFVACFTTLSADILDLYSVE
jgi:hypothetical protein